MDPQILFFDEPSAGLDPISSRLLDELIVQSKESLGATVVMVTHELPSIFGIATNVYREYARRGGGTPAPIISAKRAWPMLTRRKSSLES